jgi:DNA polymerase III sliding clamp (beta) subunit (PCNA family)
MRPHLSAVGIDFKKDHIVVIGTDGHVLHKHVFPAKIKTPVVISVDQTFCEVTKFFQEATVSVSDKFIKVQQGTTSVVSRLNATRYVDYANALKGSDRPSNVRLDRKELLSRMEVVDIGSSWSIGDILLTLSPGKIHLFAQDSTIGKDAESEFAAEHQLTGNVRLKSSTLKQVLGTITEDVILMSIDDPTKNIYIQPEDNKDITLSIMPLQLN